MFSSKLWVCTLVAAVLAVTSGSAVVQSICSLPKPNVPKGSCRGSDIMRQWFYKADERRCRPFITCSTAVNGEANSFNSSAECAAVCIDTLTLRAQNVPQRRSSAVPNETRCLDPTPIHDGAFSISNDTVTYTCREGFVLVGASARLCLDNGTWASDEPRCDPIPGLPAVECPPPPPIDYMFGATTRCRTPGCTVTYTCQDRYTLIGNKERVCSSSGQWVGTPVCARLVIRYNQTVYNDQKLELPNGISKVHVDCVMLPRFLSAGVQPRWEKISGASLGEGSRDYWGPDSYFLYFDKLLPEEHSGTYTCSVGIMQASFQLKVLPATPAPQTGTPTLFTEIQSLALFPRKLAQFTCIMRGQPTPQLTWLHNQQPVTTGPNVEIIQQNTSDMAMSVMFIRSVSQNDAGTYTCVGNSSAGVTQATATLTIAGNAKRSVSESLSSSSSSSIQIGHLCRNSGVHDTVTVVGRVRQQTSTSSGLDAYQVQINSVLSRRAEVEEDAMVTVVTIAPQLTHLRKGSRYLFQGILFGSELYILNSDSILTYSSQLAAFVQSC